MSALKYFARDPAGHWLRVKPEEIERTRLVLGSALADRLSINFLKPATREYARLLTDFFETLLCFSDTELEAEITANESRTQNLTQTEAIGLTAILLAARIGFLEWRTQRPRRHKR